MNNDSTKKGKPRITQAGSARHPAGYDIETRRVSARKVRIRAIADDGRIYSDTLTDSAPDEDLRDLAEQYAAAPSEAELLAMLTLEEGEPDSGEAGDGTNDPEEDQADGRQAMTIAIEFAGGDQVIHATPEEVRAGLAVSKDGTTRFQGREVNRMECAGCGRLAGIEWLEDGYCSDCAGGDQAIDVQSESRGAAREQILVEFTPGVRGWFEPVEILSDEYCVIEWNQPGAGQVRGCVTRLDAANEAGVQVWQWDGTFEPVAGEEEAS